MANTFTPLLFLESYRILGGRNCYTKNLLIPKPTGICQFETTVPVLERSTIRFYQSLEPLPDLCADL